MKYLKYISAVLFMLAITSCRESIINGPEDNIASIPQLDTYISDGNYQILQENRFSNVSVAADIFAGREKLSATLEAQGAGSRYFPKWGYYVRLDNGQEIGGENSFNLSAQPHDRTMLRSILASYIYSEAGFEVFHSSHVFLKINGKPKGLYLLTEKIDEVFFAKRDIPVHELIKVIFEAKFSFTELNNPASCFEKKIPDDNNLNNLRDFIHCLDNSDNSDLFQRLGKYLDIRQYLMYHAVTSVLNNLDGFENNFYLVKDYPDSPYRILPWDFDKTFDTGINVGLAGNNAIIRKLLQNDSCLSIYKSDLRMILNSCFTEDRLYPIIDSVYIKIKGAYNEDPYLGANGISLEDEISELKRFIRERRAYLLNNIDSFRGLTDKWGEL
ncbi:MAG: hypothetical protein HF314_07720 [Ignavibacteria bacterium]|nr:hypothetical protein [Ignavibacteria bacterium]MCU7517072.1 hypothetical protein [Ignavibacteria bacterium]